MLSIVLKKHTESSLNIETCITALEPHSVQEKKLNESFYLALDLIFKIIILSSQKMLI